jgi:hypothetical protein
VLGELIVHYERLMRETPPPDPPQRPRRARHESAEPPAARTGRQLEYRATHDPLTGALNRGAVIDHASRCLEQGDMALIVLDIDHFKQVNDDFGHPAGDGVIQAVVDCLKGLLGRNGHRPGRRRRVFRRLAHLLARRGGARGAAHLRDGRPPAPCGAHHARHHRQRGPELEPRRHGLRDGLQPRRPGPVPGQARGRNCVRQWLESAGADQRSCSRAMLPSRRMAAAARCMAATCASGSCLLQAR